MDLSFNTKRMTTEERLFVVQMLLRQVDEDLETLPNEEKENITSRADEVSGSARDIYLKLIGRYSL